MSKDTQQLNMKNKNSDVNKNYVRMPLSERIVASAGGITSCIDMIMIQTFLMYFYTDVIKINAVIVGTIFLVVRIITAVLAPVFGIFLDRTTTPWGKYRPYYIIMGIPSAIFGFLTFTAFDMGKEEQYTYIIITYFLYSIFSSIGGIPKGAMGPMMTKNIDDRISMGFLGYIFAVIGSVITISGAPLLVGMLGGGNEVKGYSMTMAVFACFSITLSIVQVIVLKERYPVLHGSAIPKYSIRQMVGSVFCNRSVVIVLLITASINLSIGLKSAVMIHYLKYYFKQPEMMAFIGLLTTVGLFIGAILSPTITKKVGIRMNLVVSNIATILTTGMIFIIPPNTTGIHLYITLLFISNLFNGLATPAQGALMPNAIDYVEWKTSMNIGAFMNSLNSFVSSVSIAFSGVMVGMVLTLTGYRAGEEQASTALFGIKILVSILPALAGILSLATIWLGDTEKEHKKIISELMERRTKEDIKVNE